MEQWIEFLRAIVRPTLVWGGFAALTVMTLMDRFSVTNYAVIVNGMVLYYFATRSGNGRPQ